MDLVLGLSMTSSAVRLMLIEGASGGGATVDHYGFDIATLHQVAAGRPADHAVDAVLGTQAIADAGGHHLRTIGVTWTDDAYNEAALVLESLATEGFYDIVAVPALDAAEELAHGIADVVGSDEVAVCIVESDASILAMIKTGYGDVIDSAYEMLDNADWEELAEALLAMLDTPGWAPEGVYVVGSAVDLDPITAELNRIVTTPVVSTTEPELALARGAAMVSARAREIGVDGAIVTDGGGGPRSGASPAKPGAMPRIARLAALQDATSGGGQSGEKVGDRQSLVPSRAAALTSVLVGAVLTFVVSVTVALVLGFAPEHKTASAGHKDLVGASARTPAAQPPAPIAPPPQPAPRVETPAPEAVSTAPSAPALADPVLTLAQQDAAAPAPDASLPADQQAAAAAPPADASAGGAVVPPVGAVVVPPAGGPIAPPVGGIVVPPAGAPGAPPADTAPGAAPQEPDHMTLRERLLRRFPGLRPAFGDQPQPGTDAPAQTPPP